MLKAVPDVTVAGTSALATLLLMPDLRVGLRRGRRRGEVCDDARHVELHVEADEQRLVELRCLAGERARTPVEEHDAAGHRRVRDRMERDPGEQDRQIAR